MGGGAQAGKGLSGEKPNSALPLQLLYELKEGRASTAAGKMSYLDRTQLAKIHPRKIKELMIEPALASLLLLLPSRKAAENPLKPKVNTCL